MAEGAHRERYDVTPFQNVQCQRFGGVCKSGESLDSAANRTTISRFKSPLPGNYRLHYLYSSID